MKKDTNGFSRLVRLKKLFLNSLIENPPLMPTELTDYFKNKVIKISEIFEISPNLSDLLIIKFENRFPKKDKNLRYPFLYFYKTGRINNKSRKIPQYSFQIQKIILDFDVYKNHRKRNLSILMEALRFILENFCEVTSEYNVSYQLSIAISWCIVKDDNDKKYYEEIWDTYAPKIRLQPTNVLDLKNYILNIGKKFSDRYLTQIFKIINCAISNPEFKIKPIHCFSLNNAMSYLTKNEYQIYSLIIKNNTTKVKEIAKIKNTSNSVVSRAIKKLRAIYLLRYRWFLNLKRLGLESFLLAISIKNDNAIQYIKNYYNNKYLRNFLIFEEIGQSSNKLIIMNYYFPAGNYTNKKINEWINETREIIASKQIGKLILGEKERHEKRIYVQRPELYSFKEKRWIVDFYGISVSPEINKLTNKKIFFESNRDIDREKKEKVNNVTIQHKELSIYLYINSIENFNSLYKKVIAEKKTLLPKNRNRLLSIYQETLNNKLIMKKYVLPFFPELGRLIILMDLGGKEIMRKYYEFVKNISLIIPISNTSITHNNLLISFLGVPKEQLESFRKILFEKFGSDILFFGIKSAEFGIETTPQLQLVPTKNSWKFRKPQPLFLKY